VHRSIVTSDVICLAPLMSGDRSAFDTTLSACLMTNLICVQSVVGLLLLDLLWCCLQLNFRIYSSNLVYIGDWGVSFGITVPLAFVYLITSH